MCTRLLLAFFLAGTLSAPLRAQSDTDPVPLVPELVAKIPEDLREQASKLMRMGLRYQQNLIRNPNAEIRLTVMISLTSNPDALDFVIDKIPSEDKRTRDILLGNIPAYPHWGNAERLPGLIEKIVANDPEPEIVEKALDTMARVRLLPLKEMALKRAADMERNGRSDLLALEERWVSRERGVMLPRFLQDPPPVFGAKAPAEAIRWVAFGDFGTGKESQTRTAAAIAAEHRKKAFHFGITLGDNFYSYGMNSPSDPRWRSQWEDLYTGMGIEFFSTLGNHDWYGVDSPAAEILYTSKSKSWRMPATYYTFTAGPVQFFAIDTDVPSKKQLLWLDTELAKSTATWRVVYGHVPLFVSSPGYRQTVDGHMNGVWDILKARRADLYIAGHHHSLQHLKPREGLEFVISGGGGASSYSVLPNDENALFASSIYGFTVFEADKSRIAFRHLDWDGNELYRYSFAKAAK